MSMAARAGGRWMHRCVCSTWEQVGKFEGAGDTAY